MAGEGDAGINGAVLDSDRFAELMERLADAWGNQDVEKALACFDEDAVYMEPPDRQLFQSHPQLRPYFGALKPGAFLRLHHIWFDPNEQVGSAEYSFGREGQENAVHDVTVVEVRDGRIAFWREYQRRGPQPFREFLATGGKTWQWHIGNYP